MKKIITLIIATVLIVVMLTGCAITIPEGLSGIDASKLLLAQQRLNSSAFNNADNIFNSGAEAYAQLWEKADENLTNITISNGNATAELSSLTENYRPLYADESATWADGSYFERNGNTYTWTNLAEYSNSYEYFANITENVKSSAEAGATVIDNVKKHVRVVDTWVNYWYTEYYLHVEENSETLISRNEDKSEYNICIRYKRADGANVYELYQAIGGGAYIYSKYIPGELFYYFYDDNNGFEHDFLAENTKGFWEVIGFAGTDPHYQVSCMVLKDDICYEGIYDVSSNSILGMNIISSDKATDILNIRKGYDRIEVSLFLQSFDGYKHVEIEATEDQVGTNHTDENAVLLVLEQDGKFFYQTSGRKSATLVLKNGMRLENQKLYLDGKVQGSRNMVKFNNKENGNNGYTAEIGFDILTPNYEDAIPVIKDFIDYLGLECKRNLGRTLESVKIAYSELEQFVKYHKWNGSPIYTAESIHQGFANHEARIKALVDLYNEVKDTRVINYNDVGQLSAWMSFPAITNQSSKNSFAEGSSITVTDIELSVEDTLLFVVNEPYVINFALVSAETESGLIHINTENGAATVYEGEEIFKIKGSATFTLPEAAVGRYALVAYISTEDGIRSSDYTPVKFNQVSGSVTHSAGVVISTGKNESSELTITYSKGDEIEVTVGAAEEGAHSYESMKFALEEAAYAYGFAEEDAKLEVKLDGNWQQLTGNESQLEAGTYRLKFSVKNGAKTYSGYVYTSYSV